MNYTIFQVYFGDGSVKTYKLDIPTQVINQIPNDSSDITSFTQAGEVILNRSGDRYVTVANNAVTVDATTYNADQQAVVDANSDKNTIDQINTARMKALDIIIAWVAQQSNPPDGLPDIISQQGNLANNLKTASSQAMVETILATAASIATPVLKDGGATPSPVVGK